MSNKNALNSGPSRAALGARMSRVLKQGRHYDPLHAIRQSELFHAALDLLGKRHTPAACGRASAYFEILLDFDPRFRVTARGRVYLVKASKPAKRREKKK